MWKMEKIKLKPCPFCGGNPVIHVENGVRVVCPHCSASSKCLIDGHSAGHPNGGAIYSVVEAWNKRPGEQEEKNEYRGSCGNI